MVALRIVGQFEVRDGFGHRGRCSGDGGLAGFTQLLLDVVELELFSYKVRLADHFLAVDALLETRDL